MRATIVESTEEGFQELGGGGGVVGGQTRGIAEYHFGVTDQET